MAVKYPSRLSAPAVKQKEYVKTTHGGDNYCILIDPNTGSVMPNCVGYAWGRWRELLKAFHKLSRGNAEVWWGNRGDGYARSQTPKLGSVICWSKGSPNTGADGAGHVAIVEAIKADGTIVTSNSNYGGTRFYLREFKPPYSLGGTFKFQGFIHIPVDYVANVPTPPAKKTNEQIAAEVKRGDWGNGQERKDRLTKAGYDYNAIQAIVDRGSKPTPPPAKKTNEQIAAEVKRGDWGNGQERKDRLTKAGYDYNAIQAIVNRGAATPPAKKTNAQLAEEVKRGDWGNGQARKDALTKAGYDYNAVQAIVNGGAKNHAGRTIKMGIGTVLRDKNGSPYSLKLKSNATAKVLSQIGDGVNGNTLLRFKASWLIGVTEAYVYLKDVRF